MICIAETHLVQKEVLNVDGYKWLGRNREKLHKNAKFRSGGIGFFIKYNILKDFNVKIY